MKKHYHVMGGLHGYLPNFNNYAATKGDAIAQLREWRSISMDMGSLIAGKCSDLYIEVSPCGNGDNEYYEAAECCQDCGHEDGI